MVKAYYLLMLYSSEIKTSILDTYWNISYNVYVTTSSFI